MSQKKLTFRSWIEQEGIDTIAKVLKVEKATIYNWKAGRSIPAVAQMKLIKRYSKGAIDYAQMIDRRSSPVKGN